jgi:hypothetical protein
MGYVCLFHQERLDSWNQYINCVCTVHSILKHRMISWVITNGEVDFGRNWIWYLEQSQPYEYPTSVRPRLPVDEWCNSIARVHHAFHAGRLCECFELRKKSSINISILYSNYYKLSFCCTNNDKCLHFHALCVYDMYTFI